MRQTKSDSAELERQVKQIQKEAQKRAQEAERRKREQDNHSRQQICHLVWEANSSRGRILQRAITRPPILNASESLWFRVSHHFMGSTANAGGEAPTKAPLRNECSSLQERIGTKTGHDCHLGDWKASVLATATLKSEKLPCLSLSLWPELLAVRECGFGDRSRVILPSSAKHRILRDAACAKSVPKALFGSME